MTPPIETHFVIRLAEQGDVDLHKDPAQTTLADLRAAVRQAHRITANRRLKFIYQGRILTNTTNILSEVVGTQQKVYILGAIGDPVSAETLAREEGTQSLQPIRPQRTTTTTTSQAQGFDRLRAAGFSDEEVASLRAQFGALYGTSGPDQAALEDEWLDTGAESVFTREAVAEVLIWATGVWLGVGVFILACLGIFSQRRQWILISGALFGFIIKFFYDLI